MTMYLALSDAWALSDAQALVKHTDFMYYKEVWNVLIFLNLENIHAISFVHQLLKLSIVYTHFIVACMCKMQADFVGIL